ncbi:unnamed protein product [Allacma fusca]|uniref:Uncharacterized protein n=1 Tax=Allacma fusca TaxID=39272 RepID=A0A8J2LCS7_9HEXA|nr:unnamed protein product [Allacma fusca]
MADLSTVSNQIRDATPHIVKGFRNFPTKELRKSTCLKNDKGIQKNDTGTFRLKTQIREMINNPMVRLFRSENLTGESQEYHSGLRQEYTGFANETTMNLRKRSSTPRFQYDQVTKLLKWKGGSNSKGLKLKVCKW